MSSYWERLCVRFEDLNVHLKVLVFMLLGSTAALIVLGTTIMLMIVSSIVGEVATAFVAIFLFIYLMLYFTLSDD